LNIVERSLSTLSEVVRQQITGEVDKSVTFRCPFSTGCHTPKDIT